MKGDLGAVYPWDFFFGLFSKPVIAFRLFSVPCTVLILDPTTALSALRIKTD